VALAGKLIRFLFRAGIFKSRIDGTSVGESVCYLQQTIDAHSIVERISDVHTSSRSPRLTPDGSAIVSG
jgi:hypothetical protein